MFPGGPGESDLRLRPKSQVFVAVLDSGESKAYPLQLLGESAVINDAISGVPVVLLTDVGGGVQAFLRENRIYTLAADGGLIDEQGPDVARDAGWFERTKRVNSRLRVSGPRSLLVRLRVIQAGRGVVREGDGGHDGCGVFILNAGEWEDLVLSRFWLAKQLGEDSLVYRCGWGVKADEGYSVRRCVG